MSNRAESLNSDWIADALAKRRELNLDRIPPLADKPGPIVEIDGRRCYNFSSNDYLNLSMHPKLISAAETALHGFGTASSASRLMSGNLAIHCELERQLARYKETEAALLFSSGYLANIGAVSGLFGRHDCIFADKLVHASIIDGIAISGAKLYRFRHNNMESLEELLETHAKSRSADSRALVITESVFSMDGDLAPLVELVALSKRYGAMIMVDEAHALGVFGPEGRGLVNQLGLNDKVDICTGTLSKSFGSYGGFVACSKALRELLLNTSRSFIYNTSLPPANIATSLAALELLTHGGPLGTQLLSRAKAFCEELSRHGLETMNSASQIVPVHIGPAAAAVNMAKRLLAAGIFVQAMRPPTVPANTCRLRFSVTLGHDIATLATVAQKVADEFREPF